MNRNRAMRRVEQLGGRVLLNDDGSTRCVALRGPECRSLDVALPFSDAAVMDIRETGITSLQGIERFTNLRELWISDRLNHLHDISALQHVNTLRELHVDSPRVSEISALSQLSELETAFLVVPITDLSPLSGLPALQDLSLRLCGTIADLSPLTTIPRLTDLSLDGDEIVSLDGLVGAVRLRSFGVCSERLTDISAIGGWKNLEELSLYGCANLGDLPPEVGELAQLRKLSVCQCNKIRVLPPLDRLGGLEDFCLKVSDGGPIFDLRPLAACRNLQTVTIWAPIEDLTALAALQCLRVLEIPGGRYPGREDSPNGGGRDLSPLHGLKHLERLDICGTPASEDRAEVERLRAALPNCRVTAEYDLGPPAGANDRIPTDFVWPDLESE